MEDTTKPRRILVISANRVGSTGTVSFKFMIDCKYPNRDMPQDWGYVWTERDGGHPINVFNGKSGMIMGGGWDAPKDPLDERDIKWQKEMLENVPSCTLLMDMPTFQWWEKMCLQFGVEFEHHHFDGDLWTS